MVAVGDMDSILVSKKNKR